MYALSAQARTSFLPVISARTAKKKIQKAKTEIKRNDMCFLLPFLFPQLGSTYVIVLSPHPPYHVILYITNTFQSHHHPPDHTSSLPASGRPIPGPAAPRVSTAGIHGDAHHWSGSSSLYVSPLPCFSSHLPLPHVASTVCVGKRQTDWKNRAISSDPALYT